MIGTSAFHYFRGRGAPRHLPFKQVGRILSLLRHVSSAADEEQQRSTGAIPSRIVFGSCSDSTEDLTYWDRILESRPDVVILMGDNVYGKRSTLQHQYDQLISQPSFQKLQQACKIIAAVDDNDLKDASGCTRDTAIDLFQAIFKPNLASNDSEIVDGCVGLYQAYQWEHHLQILLLDVRTFSNSHEPVQQSVGGVDDINITFPTVLGKQQWVWLEEKLNQAPKDMLSIIVSPIQVLATGHRFECWNQQPEERQRLLDIVQGHNALLLSGDRHTSALYRHSWHGHQLRNNPNNNPTGLYEVTCSSFTHTVPPGLLDSEIDKMRISGFCYENNFGMLDLQRYQQGGTVQASIRSTGTGATLFSWELPICHGGQTREC